MGQKKTYESQKGMCSSVLRVRDREVKGGGERTRVEVKRNSGLFRGREKEEKKERGERTLGAFLWVFWEGKGPSREWGKNPQS